MGLNFEVDFYTSTSSKTMGWQDPNAAVRKANVNQKCNKANISLVTVLNKRVDVKIKIYQTSRINNFL